MGLTPGFLGVTASLTGKRWRQRPGDERLGQALAQRLGLPEIVGRVIAARGVAAEDVDRYLAPTLRDFLPNPSVLVGLDAAAERIARAVETGETIAIFGDYDVDGATSTALFRRFLEGVGARVLIHIPDRRLEGYGPNLPALLRLKLQGARLAITVDCGTAAHAALEAAAAAGLEVIVVDHHTAEPALPRATAVVNPNRLDDVSGLGALAAVGVSFLVAIGVNRVLRTRGWFGASRPPFDLMNLLDLVALGTVADVVPLTGLNRALVAQGLKVLAQRRNPGLKALGDGAGIAERVDAYHLGYVLGPRVNAGGRVGKADLGARLLATDDPAEAALLARDLEVFNAERKAIEAEVLAAAIVQVETIAAAAAGPVVIAAGEDWHAGVIGIVASRLKERYNRPACVIAWEEGPDGQRVGKGSGRSVGGVDLGAAIIAARQAGLLLGGGGHRMAAGFTLAAEGLPAFRDFLGQRIGADLAGSDLTPELGVDGLIQPGAATPDLVRVIAGLGPFGTGNAEPRFALSRVRVAKADVVGTGHVRCFLAPAMASGGERLKAIAFRAMESALGPALLGAGGEPLHLAGHLRADTWQGRDGVQLIIEDAAHPGQP